MKVQEAGQKHDVLGGRQIINMILHYFRTNRTLQEMYTWADLQAIQWLGDDRLDEFYARWKKMLVNLSVEIPEEALRLDRCTKLLHLDFIEKWSVIPFSAHLIYLLLWHARLACGDEQS